MDVALSRDEQDKLENAGYQYSGGGLGDGGQPYLKFTKGGEQASGSRAYWRAVIAELDKPPMEDEIAFGKDAWVYCSQHMRAHQTGWCSVSPRDKVGLGVNTADEAIEKCRAWGFDLYSDLYPSGGG